MLAEEAEHSSRSGWESRGKGHSLTLQLVRVQASMRVVKGLHKGQEPHRCTDREARGNPLLSRRSAAPPPAAGETCTAAACQETARGLRVCEAC